MARVAIEIDPLMPSDKGYAFGATPWPARWIGPAAIPSDAGVWAFRRSFTLEQAETIRLHVSADQRYVLYIDGQRQGRGPERGDPRHWMYDSYEVSLNAGAHTIVAIVWWASLTGQTPPAWSQMTQRPGFILLAEGAPAEQLHTGAAWSMRSVDGIVIDPAGQIVHFPICVGPHVRVDGRQYPWGIEAGQGDGWQPATVIENAALASLARESTGYWLLRRAMLPAMRDEPIDSFTIRHIDAPPSPDTAALPMAAEVHRADEAAGWSRLLVGDALTIPPHTRRRVLIDLGRYACAYSHLQTSGGRDALVRIRWAEALFQFDPRTGKRPTDSLVKGDRNEIAGRVMVGYGDAFITDGGSQRAFDTLWWNAGRYVEVFVETKDQPLVLEGISFRATGYPYPFESSFEASDPRLGGVRERALHTLRMCSHETSMDCPYYEQLNYAGDTRIQSLVAMTHSRDDRLVRKGIRLFDWSRTGDTWNASRHPSSMVQTIPTFAFAWVGMVRDYALWRGDRAFVRSVMPGVRAVMERWRLQVDSRGLVVQPEGWNFIDWVPGWRAGMSNPACGSRCGIVQWQFIYTLMQLAELEEMMNEPLLAQRNRQTAAALAAAAERYFYNAERQLLADDLEQTRFSEHAQVLALLSGEASEHLRPSLAAALEPSADVSKATIYFGHYTFEALHTLGQVNGLGDRLNFWFDHERLGLSTLLEQPEPSRSDCHAWSAHPAFHFLASVLGIRPASFGFASVDICPQLGSLEFARGEMVHPLGKISVEIRRNVDTLHGIVHLPPGVGGRLRVNRGVIELEPGAKLAF